MVFMFKPVMSFIPFCRLHSEILAETSSILLYLFLRNIFVTSDIKIKEENIFCDNIKGNEIFPAQQVSELKMIKNVPVFLYWFLDVSTSCFWNVSPDLRMDWGALLCICADLFDAPCRIHRFIFSFFFNLYGIIIHLLFYNLTLKIFYSVSWTYFHAGTYQLPNSF